MTHIQADGLTVSDQSPLRLDHCFSTELHITEPGEGGSLSPPGCPRSPPSPQSPPSPHSPRSPHSPCAPQEVWALQKEKVLLSTTSQVAQKLGTQQLIPRSLAAPGGRSKTRHHTTVVSFPIAPERSFGGGDGGGGSGRSRHSTQGPEMSWEDYDSDGDGFSLRRNRRNKSYRVAILDLDGGRKQQPQAGHPDDPLCRTIGRKRNQKHGGSFKNATPRLYQEICERGLQSTNQDELIDDFVVVEPQVEDQGIVVKSYRPTQLIWSHLPQVKEGGILDRITPEERKRQDGTCAIFEIITSEYSYLHSLGILVRHFKNSEPLRQSMTATEHHHLFSNIAVIEGCQRFADDPNGRHHAHPVIRDISDIVQHHSTHNFEPYIVYCSNETFQQRTLQKLLTSNTVFKETLKQIEGSADCGGLPMISFLILPMQRVTRLPLLLDTICQKTPDKTAEYFAAVWSLWWNSCNDGARLMERTEQMYTIQKQMDFAVPLVSSSRWLRKRGELAIYYLFLFNDVLIVTKKKSEESFVVTDYATMDNVEVEMGEDAEGRSTLGRSGSGHQVSFRLRMSKNSDGKAEQDHPGNRVQVRNCCLSLFGAYFQLIHYQINWCHGERMRDGERGWFPANCAKEITNLTAMEQNVQRMKRLRKETNVLVWPSALDVVDTEMSW
uniref:Rho guanine nucleotide exchange factor (GEF) 16 n=1 Tax=Gadus morhua TaxID=8049 RepID=A0A8C4ZM45_GADMO